MVSLSAPAVQPSIGGKPGNYPIESGSVSGERISIEASHWLGNQVRMEGRIHSPTRMSGTYTQTAAAGACQWDATKKSSGTILNRDDRHAHRQLGAPLPRSAAVPRLASQVAAIFVRYNLSWKACGTPPSGGRRRPRLQRMQKPHRSSVCRRALVTPGAPQI